MLFFLVAETDTVQALLAKYLNRRLQNTGQLSTPPSASKLFSLNKELNLKNQVLKKQNDLSLSRETDEIDKRSMKNENQGSQDEYDDYTDDLEGYEDSDMSRTRFDLLEGNFSFIFFFIIIYLDKLIGRYIDTDKLSVFNLNLTEIELIKLTTNKTNR